MRSKRRASLFLLNTVEETLSVVLPLKIKSIKNRPLELLQDSAVEEILK